jgi:sialate O-acetylesterase
MRVEDGAIRLRFSSTGGGLVARGGALKHFAIAGEDRKFVRAEAGIEGDTILVRSQAMRAPVAVRYAWADNPAGCNLYGANGLPHRRFGLTIGPGALWEKKE